MKTSCTLVKLNINGYHFRARKSNYGWILSRRRFGIYWAVSNQNRGQSYEVCYDLMCLIISDIIFKKIDKIQNKLKKLTQLNKNHEYKLNNILKNMFNMDPWNYSSGVRTYVDIILKESKKDNT